MNTILSLLRVNQWVKNAFILFPLVFSGHFLEGDRSTAVLMAFFAFCCLASGVYIFNDLLDFRRDRLHPKKKNRPLSAGLITPTAACALGLPLVGIGLACSFWINSGVGAVALFYIAIHVIYNLWAKDVVILDVFFIAFGFQLRIWAGSLAAGISPSEWLQMCVFVLSLFLGFTKRRSELSDLKEKAAQHRHALLEYNFYLLDQIIMITAALTVMFYGLYSISPEVTVRTHHVSMVYSLGFVIFGVFRYLYLVHVKKLGGEPGELLLHDTPLIIDVGLWLIFIAAAVYFV
ncbi:MAG: decaprenyl-phosphate phosphoribosyltransferase [Candidatus Omnitrophica bacterium]|nr:decaprenyl-phosphate phosphoribosyltransferase [Candidatus Omnitrophota bacterium]